MSRRYDQTKLDQAAALAYSNQQRLDAEWLRAFEESYGEPYPNASADYITSVLTHGAEHGVDAVRFLAAKLVADQARAAIVRDLPKVIVDPYVEPSVELSENS